MTKTERFCDEMERLHRKATPGPWEWYAEDASMISLITVGDPLEGHVLTSSLCDPCHKRHGKVDGKVAPFEKSHCLMPGKPDRDHIVAMQNSQEALLRVVRAAEVVCGRCEYKQLREALDALPNLTGGDDG